MQTKTVDKNLENQINKILKETDFKKSYNKFMNEGITWVMNGEIKTPTLKEFRNLIRLQLYIIGGMQEDYETDNRILSIKKKNGVLQLQLKK